MVTEEQHRAVQRLALQVLASVRLDGDLEKDRQEAVNGLRQNLSDAPVTAPTHRARGLHPNQEFIKTC